MEEHVWYVHQEMNHSKSAISVLQNIVGSTDQAPKDVDDIKSFQKHGFFWYQGSLINQTLMNFSNNINEETTENS